MKPIRLSIKLYAISALVLSVFSIACIVVLYRAQTKQAETEMKLLLQSEIVSLSALVNAQPQNNFDFEISNSFLSQFSSIKPNEFFRFIEASSGKILRETPNSPELNCSDVRSSLSQLEIKNKGIYRVQSSLFKPEIDPDLKKPLPFEVNNLCLVVGISEAPYKAAVASTLIETVPLLLAIVFICILALILFVRGITKDLSKLNAALESSDFSTTHKFPKLPDPQTLEVITVVEKLESLHKQVAGVHKEMWLFLGRASHQLKTPVTAIQSTLQVLLRKERSKEELLEAVKDIETVVNELGSLSKNLISSSRISFQESNLREQINLSEYFAEQCKLFDALAKSFIIELRVQESPNIFVFTNRMLLNEITGNLIDNAIRYSSTSKGNLTPVFISWNTQGDRLRIVFSDSGPGIPLPVTQSLFQPFTRGNKASGSGLGLATARRAALALGGDLALSSTGPSGSTLILSLKAL